MKVKTYIKSLQNLASQQISALSDSEKLTNEERKILVEMSAIMLNHLSEPEFDKLVTRIFHPNKL